MPNFDFRKKTPQGQINVGGPRDQGTEIGLNSAGNMARAVGDVVSSVQDMAQQRANEQAKSDMSAFQAERIRREQDFREKSATITNAAEYKKAVDKHISDLDKYAAGKREDGTKVFRNNMGSAAYKQFSNIHNAKFKAAGSEHSFQLDRKRDKLNYRMSINSGIKNNNPDAINQSYENLVASGHLTAEEATIEKERDIKVMTLNHFSETQATMMLGVEETLNRVNKESVEFDGTGVKRRTDSLADASKTIKGAFENYKAEVYTNKNLNDQERKKLINNAKESLRYLESVKKTEYAAKKEAVEVEKANLHSNYLRDVAKNPAAITEIGKRYIAENPNLSEKTLTKITTQAVDAHKRFVKSAGDFEAEKFGRMTDLSLRSSIMSSTLGTAVDYDNAINEVSKIGDPVLRSATMKWIEENKPGVTPKDPILSSNTKALYEDLKMSLGLDLTRTQAEKLSKHQKYGHPDTYWDPKVPEGFPDPKMSRQVYVGGLTRGERLNKQEEIVQNYTEIYNKSGQVAADEYKDKALEGINKDYNTAKFLNNFLRKPLIKKR